MNPFLMAQLARLQAPQQPQPYRPRSKAAETRPATTTTTFLEHPLQPPSPFSHTHVLLEQPIVIAKSKEGSFGLSIQVCKESALVVVPDAKRRRRVPFLALMVSDPTTQNTRSGKPLLHKGDLILSLDGTSMGGKTFAEACQLFRSSGTVNDAGAVQAKLVIARRHPPTIVPRTVARPPPNRVVGPLSMEERDALVQCMLEAVRDPTRMLGRPIDAFALEKHVAAKAVLGQRSPHDLLTSWNQTDSVELLRVLMDQARAHWVSEWANESDEIRQLYPDPITDATRHMLRAAPKPTKGCKCGSDDHEYVNHVRCPLYSCLRRLDDGATEEESAEKVARKLKKSFPKDLNAVENAFKDRVVRERKEQHASETEARFAARMEDLQVSKLGKAVFAPSLSTMVLSAVADLYDDFKGIPVPETKSVIEPEKPPKNEPEDDVDSDDDEDDVPLAVLKKRAAEQAAAGDAKKAKIEVPVRLSYLAKLLRHISSKWGHVFAEPDHMEYSWRWEVFHGQSGNTAVSWDPRTKNPRPPGSLTMESIQFLLDDNVLASIETTDSLPMRRLLAFVLCTKGSSVVDELLALTSSGVVTVDPRGIPKLSDDWSTQIDFLILEDMYQLWNLKSDRRGLYGVSETIRKTLTADWVRVMDGWASTQDRTDVILEFDEFDIWRETFEEKQKETVDASEGIGKFGI